MVIVYLHWLIAVNMGVYTILSMVIWWQLSLFPIIYEFYATSILNSQNWLWNRRALFKNYHTSKRHHWRHPWFPCPYPEKNGERIIIRVWSRWSLRIWLWQILSSLSQFSFESGLIAEDCHINRKIDEKPWEEHGLL